ncbi:MULTISPECIES: hypothetical protein [Haloferax]|uniref:Transporter n=2 Tax=Haloferax gibbonsii TaxID=35746 RepID=A0A0K1IT63_HALGI|nr:MULTISPECIES: hypothetical protein [Haloferax]AKU07503.1 hypothetical protein ABY42_07025 [Haloferax gibbonsii]ELZ77906.1 hypothetical protein C454_15480 [Haloferax gibbonsii ATCC 33959]QOS11604.1 uncharacterized protein HfgLR_07310 [Haloferax gibbonsii]RDZ55372.1 hypothetical protein C5C07_07650 [Haloferax sp. Atlit-4N]REA04977.1 hypothetical protein DEQ92_01440 [Haloferax sp. Atlit-6N]
MPADDFLSPSFVLFVGGFVAAVFLFGALIAFVAAAGSQTVEGLALALAGLGGLFLVAGAVGAGVMRYRRGSDSASKTAATGERR